MTITEFLLARIAEDEAAARRAAEVFPGSWDIEDRGYHAHVVCDGPNFHYVSELDQRQAPGVWLGGALQSVANFQPARVLAECKAKRAVMREHEGMVEVVERLSAFLPGNLNQNPDAYWREATFRHLAAIYAAHPDYQQEWAL